MVTKNKVFTQIMSDKNIKGKIGRKAIRLIFSLLSKLDPRACSTKRFFCYCYWLAYLFNKNKVMRIDFLDYNRGICSMLDLDYRLQPKP